MKNDNATVSRYTLLRYRRQMEATLATYARLILPNAQPGRNRVETLAEYAYLAIESLLPAGVPIEKLTIPQLEKAGALRFIGWDVVASLQQAKAAGAWSEAA